MVKQWGNWKNIEPIGEGGAGRVYKVKNVETGKIAALKVFKNPKRYHRSFNEVEAIKKLAHPGIIPLLDYNLKADKSFAVYEYEAGGSLASLTPSELFSIPLYQRLNLCEQVCDALQAIHDAGLIHRDVKPDNLLISEDRKTIRLCDFGLVSALGYERQTATMEQVGSRYYIPPELEDGRAGELSHTSDIYSMGKVLYYVITGRIFARERHRDREYDLAIILDNPYLESISRILDHSITDDLQKRKEISSARKMKSLIQWASQHITEELPLPNAWETYRCIFCRQGTYKMVASSSDLELVEQEGYTEGAKPRKGMVFLECENCGNCQRFKLFTRGKQWFPGAFNTD